MTTRSATGSCGRDNPAFVPAHASGDLIVIDEMTKTDKPKSLGKVLDALVDRMGIRGRLSDAEIVEAWAALAGDKVNAVTDSAWLKGDTLYVKVSSAAWRHKLHLGRTSWRERLNQELGKEAVAEIVFR